MASTKGLLRKALAVSLDVLPAEIHLAAIEARLRTLPGALEVQTLPIWGLSRSKTTLTAHLKWIGGSELSNNRIIQLAQRQFANLGINIMTWQLDKDRAAATQTCSP